MPKQNPKKLNTIDLFAGCGGLTEGFEQSGFFNTIAGVEWDKTALNTLTHRLENRWGKTKHEFHPLNFDMQRTSELLYGWKDDPKYGNSSGLINIIKDSVDVIVGGPPCQAYSIAGRIRDANGMKDDYRNFLFETYISIVKHFRPKAFIFENVTGMLSANPTGVPIIQLIKKGFADIDYEIIDDLKKYAELDAKDYGVPQSRKRLIILGLNRKEYKNETTKMLQSFYDTLLPIHKTKTHSTVEESIGDLPKFFPSTIDNKKYSHECVNSFCNIPNHHPRFHSKRDIEIFKELALDVKTGKNHYSNIESLKKLYEEKTGKKSNIHKYNVLKPHQPSNTIVAHLYKDGLRHIHYDPDQARSITVREAARLQTFSDDFIFLGGQCDQYKMVGNAIPPKLAKIIAVSLNSLLCKDNSDNINFKAYENVIVSKSIIRS